MNFPMKYLFILLQIYGFASSQEYKYLKIGGIFPENNAHLVNAFQNAARLLNTFSQIVKLQTTETTVDTNDSYRVETAVCELADENVAAIFGPVSPKSAGVVAAICKKLRIPHFTSLYQPIAVDDFNSTDSYTRNLFPHPKMYSEALVEIIKSFRWKHFAIVYDEEDNLVKYQDVFAFYSMQDHMSKQPIRFYKLPKDSDDYKSILKDISKSVTNQILIDCTLENTYKVLEQSISVGMMNEYVNYFIASTDGYTLDLSPLSDQSANITTIRLVNPSNADVYDSQPYFMRERNYRPTLNINQMTTDIVLIQDAVTVFAKAFGDNTTFIEGFNMDSVSCASYIATDESSTSGRDVLDKIDENTVRGLSEDIHFDDDGLRDSFYIEVLELSRNTDESYTKIAVYDTKDGLQLLRDYSTVDEQTSLNMQNKIFRVLMKVENAFLRKKKDVVLAQNTTLKDLYEGFSIDLIDTIALKCKFRYEIEIVTGDQIVPKLVNKQADLAVGDITITHARKTQIDFSTPFMTLGISILYAKPHKEKAGLFSFMDPLSIDVWLHMATAFLCISIIEFFLAKLSAGDWENPHPCDDDPEELENAWDMPNSIWLAAGSIVQQGCDMLPKGVPTRLAVAFWWFFALIVISSYTANLAAFLTKENMESSIDDVEELASQNTIRYGCNKGGSTEAFFRDSDYPTYQKIYQNMAKSEPSVFVETNQEGIDRVKRSGRKYAFFMESAPIRFITHRDCNLTQIGGLLDSKEYGIGMPHSDNFFIHFYTLRSIQ